MIDRRQRLLDRFDRFDSGRRSAADHEDIDTERTSRVDLGVGGAAAAVLGDDGVDAMLFEKRQFGLEGKRTAIENANGMVEHQRRHHRIDAADQIEMLRRRLGGMRLLPAGCQEDAARRLAERGNGLGNRRNMRPAITGLFAPERAAQRDGRNAGQSGGLGGIGGNSRRIGMRCIDEQAELAVAQEAGEPFGAAETANPDRNRLFRRFFGSSGERQQDVENGALPQSLSQQARLACAAQYQNAEFCHV